MRDLRPSFQITPRSGWLNDPNGLCRIDGTWHVFHQYNPAGVTWGPPQWAHLSSPDLVHWTAQPIALAPTGSGPDSDGIWSGCVVDDHGTPTAVYTGVEATAGGGVTQTVCLATSDRSLPSWTRDPANPGRLVLGPSEALEATVFVDGSIVQVFANERLVFTQRVYPTLEAGRGIVVSGEGAALLDELTVWSLR